MIVYKEWFFLTRSLSWSHGRRVGGRKKKKRKNVWQKYRAKIVPLKRSTVESHCNESYRFAFPKSCIWPNPFRFGLVRAEIVRRWTNNECALGFLDEKDGDVKKFWTKEKKRMKQPLSQPNILTRPQIFNKIFFFILFFFSLACVCLSEWEKYK